MKMLLLVGVKCYTDGASLVFSAGTEEGNDAIYRVAATGGTPQRLTTEAVAFAGAQRWSPDGSMIAYSAHTGVGAALRDVGEDVAQGLRTRAG